MGKLGNLAAATKNKVDLRLGASEAEVLLASASKLEELRPKIGDSAAMSALIGAVSQATAKNEGVAEFQKRVQALGEAGLSAAKKVAQLLR